VSGEFDAGAPESMWRAWHRLRELPVLQIPPAARLVIVAPHPDDETLALGGLLAVHENCLLVGVTDGEASHPRSRVLTPAQLADRRRDERRAALTRLGRGELPVELAGHPDGAVDEALLSKQLATLLRPGDICLATWRRDRHPDHEAVGRAAAAASDAVGVPLWEYPVWMWHWARPEDARVPWARARPIPLSAATRARKRDAVLAFRTQLEPLGNGPDEAAVLPAEVLAHFDRDAEIVFLP
jgi:LmbE family N-acetylglucosaminyl deacetylase